MQTNTKGFIIMEWKVTDEALAVDLDFYTSCSSRIQTSNTVLGRLQPLAGFPPVRPCI